jgi:hypothetical protein
MSKQSNIVLAQPLKRRLQRALRMWWRGEPEARQLEYLIFVTRRSPDWAALAADYEACRAIAPERYLPPEPVPSFPENVDLCIDAWNEMFAVNFFRCRQVLKTISENLTRQIHRAVRVDAADLERVVNVFGERRTLIFFHDDDDWFSPTTYGLLAGLDFGGTNVAVFPLVRFERDTYTFARQGEPARVTVGLRRDFFSRYQTNCYAFGWRHSWVGRYAGVAGSSEWIRICNPARLNRPLL